MNVSRLAAALARLDAAPEPAHERIDASHRHEALVAPDSRQESVTAENDTGVGGQDVEQTEFLFRQVDAPVLNPDVTPGRIHVDVSVNDGRRGVGLGAIAAGV
jgi:hypothetical protein